MIFTSNFYDPLRSVSTFKRLKTLFAGFSMHFRKHRVQGHLSTTASAAWSVYWRRSPPADNCMSPCHAWTSEWTPSRFYRPPLPHFGCRYKLWRNKSRAQCVAAGSVALIILYYYYFVIALGTQFPKKANCQNVWLTMICLSNKTYCMAKICCRTCCTISLCSRVRPSWWCVLAFQFFFVIARWGCKRNDTIGYKTIRPTSYKLNVNEMANWSELVYVTHRHSFSKLWMSIKDTIISIIYIYILVYWYIVLTYTSSCFKILMF